MTHESHHGLKEGSQIQDSPEADALGQYELGIEGQYSPPELVPVERVSSKDQEIYKQIRKGNFKRVGELTELLPGVAQMLVDWGGISAVDYLQARELPLGQPDLKILPLTNLKDLDDSIADRLADFQGRVLLPPHLQSKLETAKDRRGFSELKRTA
jgi:hypothetical protein